ncbi:MAG: L-rhamnose mutarotase [Actinomycetota bacterium]|nr:L-rhamnose mutarotase [Actinomycetota bacterium]
MELMLHRTTLKEGAADAYRELHSRIPAVFEEALREAGVTQWSIWRDGNQLIHVIETRYGLDEMERRLNARGTIDPEWDALIAPLGEHGPGSWSRLEPIWLMTETGQTSGADIYEAGARPPRD